MFPEDLTVYYFPYPGSPIDTYEFSTFYAVPMPYGRKPSPDTMKAFVNKGAIITAWQERLPSGTRLMGRILGGIILNPNDKVFTTYNCNTPITGIAFDPRVHKNYGDITWVPVSAQIMTTSPVDVKYKPDENIEPIKLSEKVRLSFTQPVDNN